MLYFSDTDNKTVYNVNVNLYRATLHSASNVPIIFIVAEMTFKGNSRSDHLDLLYE